MWKCIFKWKDVNNKRLQGTKLALGDSGAAQVPLHMVTMDPETDGGQGDTMGKWSVAADKS